MPQKLPATSGWQDWELCQQAYCLPASSITLTVTSDAGLQAVAELMSCTFCSPSVGLVKSNRAQPEGNASRPLVGSDCTAVVRLTTLSKRRELRLNIDEGSLPVSLLLGAHNSLSCVRVPISSGNVPDSLFPAAWLQFADCLTTICADQPLSTVPSVSLLQLLAETPVRFPSRQELQDRFRTCRTADARCSQGCKRHQGEPLARGRDLIHRNQ